MAIVYLALGSNLGDKIRNLHSALHSIALEVGTVVNVSSFYRSEPWGFDSENEFVNAVAVIETELAPLEILEKVQMIEREMGRCAKTTTGYQDRPIDIDILFYDNLRIHLPQLTVPHAHLHERDFVLVPLAEVAGELIHPVLKEPVKELAIRVVNRTTKIEK